MNFFSSSNSNGSDVIIYSSLGNDYVNLSGSQQDIEVNGHQVMILLYKMQMKFIWRSPEFIATHNYDVFVQI